MKTNSYVVNLQPPYDIGPYCTLFCKEYNKKYTNSYCVETPYQQDKKTNVRDSSKKSIILFYDSKEDLQALLLQLKNIKKQIISNVSELFRKIKLTSK